MPVNASILRLRVALAAALAAAAWPGAAVAEPVDFSRDIQPLLAKRCFSCHGPDGQEGGLRLDQHDGATAELSSGVKAIVPGNAPASAILERITSTDPDVQMPPEGPRLTAAQVDAIRTWIDEGAHWKEHWAFRPLVPRPRMRRSKTPSMPSSSRVLPVATCLCPIGPTAWPCCAGPPTT
jgi:mono/diheme cytochrome c family protein